MRRAAAGVAVVLLGAVGHILFAAQPAVPPCAGAERARAVMGTLARVVVCDGDDEAARAAAGAALDAIERVDRTMSLYRPDSDLSRLNRDGFPGPVALDADLVALLAESRAISEETGGRFDVTIKPLLDHYGVYAHLGFAAPPGGRAGALSRVGWRKLLVEPRAGSARFEQDGMGVDLGGVAKGFALDRAADTLRRRGVRRAVLDLGRQLYLLGPGPNPKGLWSVGIVDPQDDTRILGQIEVPEGSVATSARQALPATPGEEHPGHVLDPRRGEDFDGPPQVTVWSPSATRADALGKAILLMPRQEAERLLHRSGEAAVTVGGDGRLAFVARGRGW